MSAAPDLAPSPTATSPSPQAPVVIVGAGLAGLTVALATGRAAAGDRAGQAGPERGRHGLGPGWHRGRAGHRRQHRVACARHPGCRRRSGRRRHRALHRPAQRRGGGVAGGARGAVFARPRGPARPAPDARGRPRGAPHRPRGRCHRQGHPRRAARCRQAPPQHPAARALDGAGRDHQPPAQARRSAALLRHLCARHRQPARRDPARGRGGDGHGRGRQGLPLHQQPRHRHRRRHCHGLARGLPGRQHGVHPVPPDLPVPPAGTQHADHRGPARRRRSPAAARCGGTCGALHGPARRAAGAGSARHRGPRHRLRDEEAWPGPCVARRPPPGRGFPEGTLPHHLRPLPGAGHRHLQATHSRGAGRPLHLRWGGDRPARPHRPARPVCRGRDHLHRPARCQPPGQQLAARVCGAGPHLCQPHPGAIRRRSCPRCPPGTRARWRTPTSRW